MLIDERPLSHEEKERFRRWLLESGSHRVAFEQAASTWGRADILQGLSELFPIDTSFDSSQQTSKRAVRYLAAGIAVAASVAGISFLGLSLWVPDGAGVSEGVYFTRVGETETIDLDDGSTIVANTDSRLSVEYSETERRVTLDRGEAYFDVEPDPNRVFSVIAGDTTVRAVGTAFSVLRDGATIEVLVSEGAVETTGTPARELELRLLAHVRSVHTPAGAHHKVAESWQHCAEGPLGQYRKTRRRVKEEKVCLPASVAGETQVKE